MQVAFRVRRPAVNARAGGVHSVQARQQAAFKHEAPAAAAGTALLSETIARALHASAPLTPTHRYHRRHRRWPPAGWTPP